MRVALWKLYAFIAISSKSAIALYVQSSASDPDEQDNGFCKTKTDVGYFVESQTCPNAMTSKRFSAWCVIGENIINIEWQHESLSNNLYLWQPNGKKTWLIYPVNYIHSIIYGGNIAWYIFAFQIILRRIFRHRFGFKWPQIRYVHRLKFKIFSGNEHARWFFIYPNELYVPRSIFLSILQMLSFWPTFHV